jgi:hypothetical protein
MLLVRDGVLDSHPDGLGGRLVQGAHRLRGRKTNIHGVGLGNGIRNLAVHRFDVYCISLRCHGTILLS